LEIGTNTGHGYFFVNKVMPTGVYKRTELHKEILRKKVNNGPFQKGHTVNVGKKRSKETKKKISNFLMGHKHSTETLAKIARAMKGKIPTNIAVISGWNRGKKLTKEHRRKLAEAKKGKRFSKKHIKHLSDAHKGLKWSEEQRIKQSGENSYFWKGGISCEPYTVDWTETLRRSIRERDKYVCQICEKPQGDVTYSVHHIDYNKKNSDPKNLITLCNKCHMKTNHNREYWKEYFHEK